MPSRANGSILGTDGAWRDDAPYLKSDHPYDSHIRCNEKVHENVQSPSMDVDGSSTIDELPTSCDSFLQHPSLEDSNSLVPCSRRTRWEYHRYPY